MQRTIDVTTARRQFGTLLDEVFYKGDVITIERKGKPIARLVPATTESGLGKGSDPFDICQPRCQFSNFSLENFLKSAVLRVTRTNPFTFAIDAI